jgi:hypothetical protein
VFFGCMGAELCKMFWCYSVREGKRLFCHLHCYIAICKSGRGRAGPLESQQNREFPRVLVWNFHSLLKGPRLGFYNRAIGAKRIGIKHNILAQI